MKVMWLVQRWRKEVNSVSPSNQVFLLLLNVRITRGKVLAAVRGAAFSDGRLPSYNSQNRVAPDKIGSGELYRRCVDIPAICSVLPCAYALRRDLHTMAP